MDEKRWIELQGKLIEARDIMTETYKEVLEDKTFSSGFTKDRQSVLMDESYWAFLDGLEHAIDRLRKAIIYRPTRPK